MFALNSYLRGMTAAAGAEVKTVLRRTAIRAGLLAFALLLLMIGLQAIAVSAYLALDRHFSNEAAALLTAIGLLVLAGIVAAVAMSLRLRPSRRQRAASAVRAEATADAAAEEAAIAAARLQSAAGELHRQIGAYGRGAALTALLVGVAVGASPRLQRLLLGTKR